MRVLDKSASLSEKDGLEAEASALVPVEEQRLEKLPSGLSHTSPRK
jgi:hypothetical protein